MTKTSKTVSKTVKIEEGKHDANEKQYDNEKRIVLFINQNRTKKEQPLMRGYVTINGVDYKISLWQQTTDSGKKYWSGNVQNPAEDGSELPEDNIDEDVAL